MMSTEEIESVAEACHESNRAYCELLGDNSQVPWHVAPQWQKQSAIDGVKFHLEHPEAKPCDSHENWMKAKLDAGWKYGPQKDVEKKEHPCMIPADQLPASSRIKDIIFLCTVRAASRILEGEEV